MAAAVDLSEWEKDPRLFLFTSLTAGSSHIITATSRLETILKANKLPFQAIDTATDEKARKLWGRRAGKRKLPGLVKEGYVIADMDEVEDWNEFGELKENIGPLPAADAPADSSANTVRATLGSLRLHDPASRAAPPPGPAPAKGPAPGVDASKIKPLPSAAPAAAVPAAAPSSSEPAPPSSEPAGAEGATKPKTAETETPAAEKSQATAAVATGSETASETAAAPAPAPAGASPPEQKKHRGSSVSDATAEEISEVEKSTAIPEAEEQTSKVEAEQTAAAEETQAQGSAKADQAGVSIED